MSDFEKEKIIKVAFKKPSPKVVSPLVMPRSSKKDEIKGEGMLGAFSGGHKCDGSCKNNAEDLLDKIRIKLGHIQHIENRYQITHSAREKKHLAFHIIILVQSTARSIERVILSPADKKEIFNLLFKIRHKWTKKFPDLVTKRFSRPQNEKERKRADAEGLVSSILLKRPIISRQFGVIDCTCTLSPNGIGSPSLFGQHPSPPLDRR